MFRVEFGPAAQSSAAEMVPNEVLLRALEMLRAVGETAAELERVSGRSLGSGPARLMLQTAGFHLHYTLDLESRTISVFSIVRSLGATG